MTLFFIGFGVLRVLGFIFFILLLIKIVLVIRKKIDGSHSEAYRTHVTHQAVSLAARRFADGDISADQFREIKSVLKE